MRQDYPEFQGRNAEVLAVGAASPVQLERFWKQEAIPFPGLSDQSKHVLRRYGQEFKWHKFGRMPALIVIDSRGTARWMHYGSSASDFPQNQEVLSALSSLDD